MVCERHAAMMDGETLADLIAVARGTQCAELCLKNARLINVWTGEVLSQDLAVHRGRFVGWGTYQGLQEIPLNGAYVAPGFIDAHLHLESTLLCPAEFAAAVVPHGTTAVVLDPHEIANVLGLRGVRALIQACEGLPLDFFFMLPSCVPAAPLDPAGAVLRAADLQTVRTRSNVLGLAEMMNFPGVLAMDPEVLDKIVLFQDTLMDGHCPGLRGLDLNAYIACGIHSDHETTDLEEAREKLAKGLALMIREGSQSKDLASLLDAVTDTTWPRCLFVSDDRHPTDLLHEGHMDAIVNRATALGMDPVRAVAMASWNPAHLFGLRRRGALAPGYIADFSVSPTLTPWNPVMVFKDGRLVSSNGCLCETTFTDKNALLEALPSPMAVRNVEVERFRVAAAGRNLRVIGVREGSLITDHRILPATVQDGLAVCDPSRDLLKVVVFNRYSGSEAPEQPAVGFVQGFGLKEGALAATVAHDAHHLIAVGASDEAISRAVRAVVESRGGFCVSHSKGVVARMPLPLAGLMSVEPLDRVCAALEEVTRAAHALGSRLRHPFMALSFLALPVIPALKISSRGLVDVERFAIVSLFV
ncbi:MAG: adenine deaminase [Desulfosoma sp.]|uniref:adenine deaminase n=1 Tax=Desulfosoma sp. TaxID=2603217 RepID=UPI004049DA1C